MTDYKLIDSGSEKKLEKFGEYTLIRPCPQAVWEPQFPKKWETHQGEFVRDQGNRWKKKKTPPSWTITYEKLQFKLMPTDFGHLGLFPEHAMHWKWMEKQMISKKNPVLNLFAYSGAATLALAQKGISVCHLDAAKGMVDWARENARLNGLEKNSVRWIVDDALKFLKREIRRKVSYQGVILDPPTFGRGSKGQVFKIERDLIPLLGLCKEVVARDGFIVLTAHTPGFTPTVLHHVLTQTQHKGEIEAGEMLIPSESFSLPSGSYARWHGK